jgi:1-acyl-sn-glycerol-3-phosphate acyltransferase
MANHVKSKIIGLVWFSYFILSILLVGAVLAGFVAVPLYLIGRFYGRCANLAEKVIIFGISLLLNVQPWLHAQMHFSEEDFSKMKSKRGVLFISNHRSHLDAFFLLAKIRGIRIFAKQTLFKIPFLGFMMWVMKQIKAPNDQAKFLKALEVIKINLAKGESVHVFPEMTRCEPGFSGVSTFALFPFHLAHQLKIDIVPIVFKHTDLAWPKHSLCLFQGTKVEMRVLPKVQTSLYASPIELKKQIQKLISQELSAS